MIKIYSVKRKMQTRKKYRCPLTYGEIHYKLKMQSVKNAFIATNLPSSIALSTRNMLRTLTLALSWEDPYYRPYFIRTR